MGFFDNLMSVFSDQPAKDAAQAQIAGLNAGYGKASGAVNQGIDALKTNYTAALQPFMGLSDTANAGVTQLKNLLGLNGAAGGATAQQTLQNMPGYQFAQTAANNSINAAAAASGTNASGNQMLELSKYNQGLASQNYNNYVSQLMPFLSTAGNAAGGIANVNMGLGNATAGQYDTLANLGYSTETGIGNANANAELAKYSAGSNIWKGIGGVASMAMGGMGGGMGSAMMGAVPGAVGPSSVGGAPVSNSLFSSVFSDKFLKEDIEQVGELNDGQPVYKYRYIGSPIFQIGLMAQDVEKVHPDAVHEVAGFKAVDYNKATGRAAQMSRFLEAA